MRGLKLHVELKDKGDIVVASFTDAWIETDLTPEQKDELKSHLLQMRGLKLYLKNKRLCRDKSHLLQMRGLKQVQAGTRALEAIRRIFYRCVD